MLRITENFYVKADDLNFELIEVKEKIAEKDLKTMKAGETYKSESSHGYFSTISGALSRFIEVATGRRIQEGCESVDELLMYIKNLKKSIITLTSLTEV